MLSTRTEPDIRRRGPKEVRRTDQGGEGAFTGLARLCGELKSNKAQPCRTAEIGHDGLVPVKEFAPSIEV